MPYFIDHPDIGVTAHMTAGERIQHSLNSGLPDDECPTPEAAIDDWHMSRVTEFGAPLAGLLVEKEGA